MLQIRTVILQEIQHFTQIVQYAKENLIQISSKQVGDNIVHLVVNKLTPGIIDLINSECEKALKVKFSCVFNPIIEEWPGVGVWKSHDDAKLQAAAEECSQVYGPDQVYAFPGNFCSNYFLSSFTNVIIHLGTCMNYTNPTTNQKQSWIYTDTTIDGDPSQFLLYYKYLDTLNCEANAEETNVFPTQIGCLHPFP